MAFAPGDVVILKSGGHSMTVVAVGDADIDCLWTGDDGELFRQSIPLVALTIVEGATEDAEAEEDEDEDKDDEDDDDEEEEEDDKKRKRR
jgi:uncharacterized protein YodC (DUF2158 family)